MDNFLCTALDELQSELEGSNPSRAFEPLVAGGSVDNQINKYKIQIICVFFVFILCISKMFLRLLNAQKRAPTIRQNTRATMEGSLNQLYGVAVLPFDKSPPSKAHSPSGKARDFDSCIRWFDSSMGCLRIWKGGNANEIQCRARCPKRARNGYP